MRQFFSVLFLFVLADAAGVAAHAQQSPTDALVADRRSPRFREISAPASSGFFGNAFGAANQQIYIVRGATTDQNSFGQSGQNRTARIISVPRARGDLTTLSPSKSGAGGFCVRTCDGFFFPAVSGGDREGSVDYCSSVCPGAETVLYSKRGDGSIEQAVSTRNGHAYASLKAAFAFRKKLNAACTCSGIATSGLTAFPIEQDMTLRRGDLVVSATGVQIFVGASRFPYRTADFVDADRYYGRLPSDVRVKIAQIQADIIRNSHVSSIRANQSASLQPGRSGRLATVYVTSGKANAEPLMPMDVASRR